jgi:hypothetical protein
MKIKTFLSWFAFFYISFSYFVYPQKAGEVIFSKKLIDPKNPTNLVSDFQSGDHIYAVAYFPKSIIGLGRDEEAKKMNVEIFLYELQPPKYSYQQPQEMQMESNTLRVSGDALQNKFLMVDIAPNKEEITAYGQKDLIYDKFGKEFYGPVKYAKAIANLEAGERTIIVKINIDYQFVAQGQFKIKGEDFSFYKSLSKELNEAVDILKMKDAIMPKAAMNDKKLEAEMIAALKNSQTYKDRIKGEVIRLVIIDPDWMIRRNEYTGVILHRYIRATAAVKNDDGTCTIWQLITFQQDYVSNKFQKTKFDGVGDPYKIPCENVNK